MPYIKLKILFASRLVYEKGVDILIDTILACEESDGLRGQLEWHICSDGDERIRIIDLSNTLGNVTYHGHISQDELRELYQSVDILFMPSRFLEMFGLTALEAIEQGTHVCGPRRGGLIDLVTPDLSLDMSDPVASTIRILSTAHTVGLPQLPHIEAFSEKVWKAHISEVLKNQHNILVIHDYAQRIGGAEAHVQSLMSILPSLGKSISLYCYRKTLTPLKRKWLFLTSLCGWGRGQELRRELYTTQPDVIWMHSVARYVGIWGIYQVRQYCLEHAQTQVLLSHHDLGYISPFPSKVETEGDIPKSNSLSDFVYTKNILLGLLSIGKWVYIKMLLGVLPENTEHIIFSEFMQKHIQNHFGRKIIHIIPHAILKHDQSQAG